jgi:hypothetical protein
MLKSRYRLLALVGIAALLAGLRLSAAQDATPEATPESTPFNCDLDALTQKQAELAARLSAFEADAGADRDKALDTLFKVGADYQQLALDCGYIPPDFAERPVGTEVARILNLLGNTSGDPLNGQVLYNGDFACASCHVVGAGTVAPPLEGTYTRVEETRLQDPKLAGYTPEQYLVESIVQPGHYVAPKYQSVMPSDFGKRLTLQNLADIIAFLESQDGPSPE